MAGFDNEVMYANNVDFTGSATPSAKVTSDGQLLIGATASPNIRVGTLSGGNNITVTAGAGTLSAAVTGTTNHAVQVGNASGSLTSLGTGSSGQVLQSGGALANPSYSTATYPSTATSTGTILRANGTNWAATTATYPDTAGTAGKVLISDGTNIVSSTPTFPNASATSGKFIQSDGTNWVASTPTMPTSVGSTGTILRSNGTNWVATTATYPTTTTANRILYSSSASVIGEITSAANSVVITDGSSVPSLGTSLTNNFTFTSSTAGGARNVTSTNTDNTNASSEGLFTASVGGTSAGDAYFRCAVGSARSYAMGIDNSASQTWKLNTGASATTGPSTGTNLISMTSGGSQTLPLQPSVFAYVHNGGANLTNVTGDGTGYTVVFDTKALDAGSNFNTTTGTFTAPVAGNYLVCTNITFTGLGAGHTNGQVYINANGAITKNQFNPVAAAVSGVFTSSLSIIYPVAATGTIVITVIVSGSTKTVGLSFDNFGYYTNVSIQLLS